MPLQLSYLLAKSAHRIAMSFMPQLLLAFTEHLRVSWSQCLRSHAVVGVGIMGAVILLAGWLFAAFSLRQPLVVGVDVAFSGMRALGAFLVLLWMQEAFVRDVERKTVLAILAYPVGRGTYVLGRFVGILLLVAATLIVWSVGLWLLGTYGSWGYQASSAPQTGVAIMLAMTGLWGDLAVIAAFMLFVVSVSTTRLLPLFMGICFAFASRGIGPVIDYLRYASDADSSLKANLLPILENIRWLLPDLAQLDWRAAMLYGHWPDAATVATALVGAAGYAIMLVVLAIAVYDRREFA